MTLAVIENTNEKETRSAIKCLEGALEEARKGDVVAVAIAFVRPNGNINTSSSATYRGAALLGAATLMQHRILGLMGECIEEQADPA